MMLSGDKMKVNSKMSHEAAEVNIFFKKEPNFSTQGAILLVFWRTLSLESGSLHRT